MRKYILLMCLTMVFLSPLAAAQEHDRTYTNRLISSQDPYLLLHAHNPVDWYPWGPEALEKARRENKPIFISVGYSTCYWCHVAEREIYSNPQIAELMNNWFVNIKIDREERPDLDQVYMRATQVLTGRGGWPNNVFLTPDLKPFYAGSYFPPEDQQGRPGFPQILKRIHQAWVEDHERVLKVAESVFQKLQPAERSVSVDSAKLSDQDVWLERAVMQAASDFDDLQGGFGTGPAKFPKSPMLSMLLAAYSGAQWTNAREMLRITLAAMAGGGIMDQLAGGFHRYSTEPGWSIPHFEKMLYDNAQLLGLYARTFEITESEVLRQAALRTAHYLSAEMQAPGGGFYSAQDAEVEGVEGASYAWTENEIKALLGDTDAERFFAVYSLTPMPKAPFGHPQPAGGVLRLKLDFEPPDDRQLAADLRALKPLRDRLLTVRNKRPQAARDEKIVVADNALAIIGFSQAGQSLHEPSLTRTAIQTANWIWKHAFDSESGELSHQLFAGKTGGPGFLDDYALFGRALISLYHNTGKKRWRSRAQQVSEAMLKRFARPDGALSSSWDSIDLVVAPPEQGDQVKPSGQSSAVALLLELSDTTGEQKYALAAYKALLPLYSSINAQPVEWGTMLAGMSGTGAQVALELAARSEPAMKEGLPLDSAAYVHARGYWENSPNAAELTLTVSIDQGYHINANPASDPLLIATQLLVDDHTDIEVEYPASQTFKAEFAPQGIEVYQGRIVLNASLPAGSDSGVPTLRLRVQACNDEVCLAPATIAVPVTGSITRR